MSRILRFCAIALVLTLMLSCQTDTIVGSNFREGLDAYTPPSCGDGEDNDADGLTDYPFDPGCEDLWDQTEVDPAVAPACSDGEDNDADGLTDFPFEPGCQSASDDDELDPADLPGCSDGIDNDGDMLIDYPDDPGCQSAGGAVEAEVTS